MKTLDLDLDGHARSSEMVLVDIGHMSLPVSGLYSNNVNSFRDITTFAVYVTGFDLEKSFSIDTTLSCRCWRTSQGQRQSRHFSNI